jgi:pyruvate/2-oxoglutarate dehydrogenase complex dihydrolipoamide acyltransferase (E2) component
MPTEIILPKLGFSMSEGRIAEWLATDGSPVSAGQPLYSIESEKAVEEIEAPASGVLRIQVEAGSTVPVGTVVGEIS